MAKKESKIEDFAEELGKLLGNAQAKAEGWLRQRTQIAKSLEGIRDTASKLLTDLGHQAQRIARKGRSVGATKRSPGKRKASNDPLPKRRKMSAKARAAISAAQKARWAKLRAAGKQK
jgi:hypothetical protein